MKQNSTNRPGIYKIQNKINGRIYIGSGTVITRRWRDHKKALTENRHYNKFLQNDWNKCGVEAYSFEVIEFVDDVNELLEREQYYLDKYFDNKVNCYNICCKAGSTLGRKPSEKTKEIWRQQRGGKDTSKAVAASVAARTGVPRTEAVKQKIKEAHLGIPMSEEAKAKLRKPKTQEHIQKLIAAKQNISSETKDKIRKARLGTHASEKTKQKMSEQRRGALNNNYGKKMSEEQKQKIRETKVRKRYGDRVFVFVHVSGVVVEISAVGLNSFMTSNNFEKSGFYALLAGRIKTYKGWRLNSSENPQCHSNAF